MPNQAPAHWSKDFVEHLRTVHFTLIAVSVGLIILALTTKPYSTEVAKNELHRILELKTNWSPDLFYHTNIIDSEQNPRRVFAFSPISPKEPEDGIDISFSPYCYGVYDRTWLELEFPTFSSKVILHSVEDRDFSDAVPRIPETLSDFGVWWDYLDRRDLTIYFPTSIGRRGKFIHNANYPIREFRIYEDFEFHPSDFSPPLKFLNGNHKFKLVADPFKFGQLVFINEPLSSKTSANSDMTFIVRVTRYMYAKIDSENVASYLRLPHADFAHSFYDLRQVANKNGVDNLSKLEDVLSKLEVSEAPVFEAFGIKFPADVATLGGTLVLLGVQLYFFIYLRKLNGGHLEADDAAWDVPWVGTDTSGLSRAIFFITVLIFPFVGIGILGEKAAERMTRGYWDVVGLSMHFLAPFWKWYWSVQLKVLGLAAAMLLSGYLGLLAWKYRPQIAPAFRIRR